MFVAGLAVGAQMERDQVSIRTKNALAKRKREADGQILGRPVRSKQKYQT